MLQTTFKEVPVGAYFILVTGFSSVLPPAIYVKRKSYYAYPIGVNGLAVEDEKVELDEISGYTGSVMLLDNESDWPTIDYRPEIESWTWDYIEAQVHKNLMIDHDNKDQVIGSCWVGTTLGVMPSGKIYAMWTSNQTQEDVNRDQQFNEALEEVVEKHGFFVNWGESNDLFISKVFTFEDVAKAAGYELREYCGQHVWVETKDPTNSSVPFEDETEAWEDCCRENRLVQE